MELEGTLRKMQAVSGNPVDYSLPLGNSLTRLNPLIGTTIELEFSGTINCIRCGRETRKSFAQGFCYPCFSTAPETEECVLRPELCRAHEGVARDMAYASEHCLNTQIVYLSLTSGLKVGVTRLSQKPLRWIDQGAVAAIELARTPNRFLAGSLEVALKKEVADKTNWRRMLTEVDPADLDLRVEKQRLASALPAELQTWVTDDEEVHEFRYPVLHYPEKIRSLNFDKEALVKGRLAGIKGQYLIFDDNRVINIRKFGGYHIHFRTKD